MKPAVLFPALVLAGCSSISWFGQSDRPSPQRWQEITANDERAVAELDACKGQARAVIERDARIEGDIGGGPGPNTLSDDTETDVALLRNMDAFEQDQRFERIVAECMRQRGYGAQEEPPAAP